MIVGEVGKKNPIEMNGFPGESTGEGSKQETHQKNHKKGIIRRGEGAHERKETPITPKVAGDAVGLGGVNTVYV